MVDKLISPQYLISPGPAGIWHPVAVANVVIPQHRHAMDFHHFKYYSCPDQSRITVYLYFTSLGHVQKGGV